MGAAGEEPAQPAAPGALVERLHAFAEIAAHAGVADENGGTVVVASLPRHVALSGGLESLACMSLAPRGLLRWYASCCNTPIGNTIRDFRYAHLGLVHDCLESAGTDLTRVFGPVRMRVNRQGAKGRVAAAPVVGFTAAIARWVSRIAWSRVT